MEFRKKVILPTTVEVETTIVVDEKFVTGTRYHNAKVIVITVELQGTIYDLLGKVEMLSTLDSETFLLLSNVCNNQEELLDID